jgi:membrane-anchored protein YejM (alkaline phosphatase superfamily)
LIFSGCYDLKPLHALKLNYLQSFLDAYRDKKKFAMFWTQDLSHDFLNLIGVVDEDLEQFLVQNKRHMDEAIFIVISDHGHRYDSIRQTVWKRLNKRFNILNLDDWPL